MKIKCSKEVIESYFDRLWPLPRSITGEGVRKTHDILSELLPLEREEIPSGTSVLDWSVPKEWVVQDAYVISPSGERLLDVHRNNLHLMGYSVPFRGKLSRKELDAHLYSITELPEAIPYVTSYYRPRWGFCLSDNERRQLPQGTYEVVVDTELINGSMTVSDSVLPGKSKDEVLISTYTCHPSMANNELSGPLVTAFLYQRLAALKERRFTYRFVFLPETIGAIAYLDQWGEHFKQHLQAGFVLTCIGDSEPLSLKMSRRGNSIADRAAAYYLLHENGNGTPRIIDFFPSGSDERQYCSPGFNLPVASLFRSQYTTYPEYHTSLDNKEFISFDHIIQSIEACYEICRIIDCNVVYINRVMHGEPCLSKRNLLETIGAKRTVDDFYRCAQWILNYSNGDSDLLAIAERSGEDFWFCNDVARSLTNEGLLELRDG